MKKLRMKSGVGTAVSFTQITQIYCLATEATETNKIDFSIRLFYIFLFHFAVSSRILRRFIV
jgi:hypothetical protein